MSATVLVYVHMVTLKVALCDRVYIKIANVMMDDGSVTVDDSNVAIKRAL